MTQLESANVQDTFLASRRDAVRCGSTTPTPHSTTCRGCEPMGTTMATCPRRSSRQAWPSPHTKRGTPVSRPSAPLPAVGGKSRSAVQPSSRPQVREYRRNRAKRLSGEWGSYQRELGPTGATKAGTSELLNEIDAVIALHRGGHGRRGAARRSGTLAGYCVLCNVRTQ